MWHTNADVLRSGPALRSPALVLLATGLTMGAFAANSVLARLALATTSIDPATFTAVRLGAGAVVLLAIALGGRRGVGGSWVSAGALFVYAAAFSLAYRSLTAGTGALVLFGAVQLTMIGAGLWQGERLGGAQASGLAVAFGGLVLLVLPGLAAPPLGSALLMGASGLAWGVYSVRGRGAGDPVAASAGNFMRAVPLALAASLAAALVGGRVTPDATGILYAVGSGGLTSGLGYVLWYAVLPSLRTTDAASAQLSVPVLAAGGGVVALGEPLTVRLAVASVAVLGGIALAQRARRRAHPPTGPRPSRNRTVPASPLGPSGLRATADR